MMKLDLSYSSINKMLFSPKLFYSHYILNKREDKIEKYLVEGKLVHCFILQPDQLNDMFIVAPGKVPTGSVVKILHGLYKKLEQGSSNDLTRYNDMILEELKEQNLYQSLKEDEKRLEKILTQDSKDYFKFLFDKAGREIVDEEIVERCKAYAEIVKSEPSIAKHLELTQLDTFKVYNEFFLEVKDLLNGFGLKGFLDRLVIDEFGNAEIIDVKTTGKTVSEFKDSVDYYNYWLQAGVYVELVHLIHKIPYEKISYSFWVIDKYEQVYNFGVSQQSLTDWVAKAKEEYKKTVWHIENMRYDLPYELATSDRVLL